MIAVKRQKSSKKDLKIELKLPEINPRRNVQSAKKNPLIIPHLPQINNISNHKNILINKENHSLNLENRKNNFDEEIKARLFEVEAAEKMVKNVLGGPEATVNIGGDLTNFQMKVEANKDLLRRQRKKSHFKEHNPNIPNEEKLEIPASPKYKSVSSKETFPKPPKRNEQMKLKIEENHKVETARGAKKEKNLSNEEDIKKHFISERKPINHEKKSSKDENSQVFKSIKEILEKPQKNLDVEAKNVKRIVKFTIEELENRLKKMNNIEGNKSCFEEIDKKNEYGLYDRKLSSAKSLGMIPLSTLPVIDELSLKNWNKVDFNNKNESVDKAIKYHKSNFNQEVDEIQKLEMKSYKSIEKMVENRKLLIDLELMKKNKSSLMSSENKHKEIKL